MLAMPLVLNNAGFIVDAIFANQQLCHNSRIRNRHQVSLVEFVAKIKEIKIADYNLIVVCDDQTLKIILNSDLEEEIKLKILPVINEKFFSHIFSKIGLARALEKASVAIPPFAIANNLLETIQKAEEIGYPIILKIDCSSGGSGVFQCENKEYIEMLPAKTFENPVLIQKKIIGTELDLSAIYFEQKLIHFSCAKPDKSMYKFGPSKLRTYYQIANIGQEIFHDMVNLGKALGANGFVNISAIKSFEDNKLYFFEADMRPNVWIDSSKFVGDNASQRIKNWFEKGEFMKDLPKIDNSYPKKMKIPYLFRLRNFEILFNRYNVWNFFLKENEPFYKFLLIRQIFGENFSIKNMIKNFTIKKIFKAIKRLPLKTIRFFVPSKRDRASIRISILKMLFILPQK